MNKRNLFRVEIITADSITDDTELAEMAQNIARAIVNECRSNYIVPEDSETFTEVIYVTPYYSNTPAIEHP